LEAQVVDAADSIAYDTHDADDAVELGLVTMDELLEIPLVAEAAARRHEARRERDEQRTENADVGTEVRARRAERRI
jgi:dGTPase